MQTLVNRVFVAVVVVSLPWLASIALAGSPCNMCQDTFFDCEDACFEAYDECMYFATTQTEMDACQTEYSWCWEQCIVERDECYDLHNCW